jgi:hypothetical protein
VADATAHAILNKRAARKSRLNGARRAFLGLLFGAPAAAVVAPAVATTDDYAAMIAHIQSAPMSARVVDVTLGDRLSKRRERALHLLNTAGRARG